MYIPFIAPNRTPRTNNQRPYTPHRIIPIPIHLLRAQIPEEIYHQRTDELRGIRSFSLTSPIGLETAGERPQTIPY
jgi:hypothetical protein